MKGFQQIHLGDAKKGVAKPLAAIDLPPEGITRLSGVRFELARDDLDYFKGAVLETDSGEQFGLRCYFRGPFPMRTELVGSEYSKDSPADADRFLELLKIPKDAVLWRANKASENY
jgi:hypothetical protein